MNGKMKKLLYHLIYFFLLVPLCFGTTVSCQNHDSVFSQHKILQAYHHQLQTTVISPHLRHPIGNSQNVLWCGTFQLAWNELGKLIEEDPRFRNEPDMVAILNKREFSRKNLNESSFVALAGFVRDNIHEKIRFELQKKFGDKARPKHIPSKTLTPRQQDIVAYAYMFKHLEFETPFEDLDQPLDFKGSKIDCFGADGQKDIPETILRQVNILSYKDKDDFVLELKTKSAGDRVILAKIAPAATLKKTIAAVDRRILADEKKRRDKTAELAGNLDQKTIDRLMLNMQPGDMLKIPKINFDLTRGYSELCDRTLIVKNPKVAKDLLISSAVQNIRFQMDEKGVRLRSEAHISLTCSATARHHEHIMIFDNPFLIIMKRRNSNVPYFALWVDNPEVLCKTTNHKDN